MNFSDLRSILQYVPQFRGCTFVVALDGAVIDSPDFSNILLDLAVLRSLNIKVVLVHGAAAQIKALGEKREIPLSNFDGTGVTDEATLEVSMDAISRLSNGVMQSLTTVKLQAASANAIHAHPAGIIKGVDSQFTGTIERIDSNVLQSFIDQDILPVVPPLGFDADGQTLRVNSDAVATEVAVALEATKLIFISHDDPREISSEREHQWSADEISDFLKQNPDTPSGFASKLSQAADATRKGIPRVHLIGSQVADALLAEIFSNEGVGLMVNSDDYQQLRRAKKTDVDELYLLIHRAMKEDKLKSRSRSEIMSQIDDFLVLEIDGNIVGSVAVHAYEKENKAELACLYVKKGHNDQGYGRVLVEAACDRAKELDSDCLFALSTQAVNYLEKIGFSRIKDLTILPEVRHTEWAENRRNAAVLVRPKESW